MAQQSSLVPSPSPRPATATTESVRVLGVTGDTVVYIFPDGQATPAHTQPAAPAPSYPTSATASPVREQQLLDELVASGTISAVQRDVVLYDQQATGMTVTDILTVRGWL